MDEANTVSVLMVRMLLRAASARGVAAHDLLAPFGVDPAVVDDAEARLPHAVIVALWQQLPLRLGDAAFGLHLAQAVSAGAFDVVDYAVRASADLEGSYRKLIRYQRLLHDAEALRLEVGGDEARISHRPPPGLAVPRHASEFILASIVVSGRRITGVDFAPRAVSFAHPAPADDAEHRRVFRCPVRFGQPGAEVVLPREVLALPGRAADPALGAVLDRVADAWLARLPRRRELVEEVRRQVRQAMRGAAPSAAAIARQMGLSPRTFLRRLRDEGVTYQDVLDGVRRDLAEAFLRDGGVKLTDLAFLLGFSEVSAFYRAFRRWTGTTPGEYRQQIAAAGQVTDPAR